MAQDYKSQRDEEIAIKTTRHQSLVKPGTSKHPDKNNDNTIDIPIETVPVRQSRTSKSISHSKSSAAEAFRIVSVVFVVFVISMTARMVGIFLLFIHVPKSIRFGCGVLAITAVITNQFMYAFLLRDFRNMNVPVVSSHNKYTNTSLHVTHIAVKRMLI